MILPAIFSKVVFRLLVIWVEIRNLVSRLWNGAPSQSPASPTRVSPFYSLVVTRLNPPRIPTATFAGHTVLVVGGTRGLGFEAALKFLSLDASLVVLTCRNPIKGLEAIKQIELRTGRKSVCELMALNLMSFESILRFTDKLSKEVQKLDVVVMNAGVTH